MRRVIHFDELNSTSVYSHQHLEELENFDVVSCDLQTLGHGQFERSWFSSNENGGNANNGSTPSLIDQGKPAATSAKYA